MIADYHDCADESGPRLGIVAGGVLDQPYYQWAVWRLIRCAHAAESQREADKRERDAKRRGRRG